MGHGSSRSAHPSYSKGGVKNIREICCIDKSKLDALIIDHDWIDLDPVIENPVVELFGSLDNDVSGSLIAKKLWGLMLQRPEPSEQELQEYTMKLQEDIWTTSRIKSDSNTSRRFTFLKQCLLQSFIARAMFVQYLFIQRDESHVYGPIDITDEVSMPETYETILAYVKDMFDCVRVIKAGHVFTEKYVDMNGTVLPSAFHLLLAEAELPNSQWSKNFDMAWSAYFLSNLTSVEASYFKDLLKSQDASFRAATVAFWVEAFEIFERVGSGGGGGSAGAAAGGGGSAGAGAGAGGGGSAGAADAAYDSDTEDLKDPFLNLTDLLKTGRFQIGQKPVPLPFEGDKFHRGVYPPSLIQRKRRTDEEARSRRLRFQKEAPIRLMATETAPCMMCMRNIPIPEVGIDASWFVRASCGKCIMCRPCAEAARQIYASSTGPVLSQCYHSGHVRVEWTSRPFKSEAERREVIETAHGRGGRRLWSHKHRR